jgi:hypothetical protein
MPTFDALRKELARSYDLHKTTDAGEGQIQAIPQAQTPEGVRQSLFQDGVAHLLTIQYFALV